MNTPLYKHKGVWIVLIAALLFNHAQVVRTYEAVKMDLTHLAEWATAGEEQ